MNYKKGFAPVLIIVIVIALALIGGGIYYFSTKNSAPENVVKDDGQIGELLNNLQGNNQDQNFIDQTITMPAISKDTACSYNSKYFVIAKAIGSEPGSDILIKYKKDDNQNIVCDYKVSTGDFEIKDISGSGQSSDQYFFALENNFLILDSGTGVNNRGLIVYDLSKQSKVFTDQYSSGDPVVKNNTITYWTNAHQPATAQNCPLLYNSGGVIVSHMSFDLSTLTKKDLRENKCVYQE